MTEKEHIQQLLDRFLESESTISEERTLKEYFCSHTDIPDEWKAYAVLFQGFQNKSSVIKKKAKVPYLWIAGIAASIIVVFLVVNAQRSTVNGNTGSELVAKTEKSRVQSLESIEIPESGGVQEFKGSTIHEKSISQPHKPTNSPNKERDFKDAQSLPSGGDIEEAVEEASREYLGEVPVEIPDEQLMAEYIASNFMTLEERNRFQEEANLLKELSDNESEMKDCVNGIGQMVNENCNL